MAPEVLDVWHDQAWSYDKRCDLWSLGIIMLVDFILHLSIYLFYIYYLCSIIRLIDYVSIYISVVYLLFVDTFCYVATHHSVVIVAVIVAGRMEGHVFYVRWVDR